MSIPSIFTLDFLSIMFSTYSKFETEIKNYKYEIGNNPNNIIRGQMIDKCEHKKLYLYTYYIMFGKFYIIKLI